MPSSREPIPPSPSTPYQDARSGQSAYGNPNSSASAVLQSDTKRNHGRFSVLKHLALFIGMVSAILVIDVLLCLAITFYESESYEQPAASRILYRIAESIEQNDSGIYTLNDAELAAELDQNGCWAALIDEEGDVVWTYHTPQDFPDHFTNNDIALVAHNHAYDETTTFIWTESESQRLFLLGYPEGQYTPVYFSLASTTLHNIPHYILLIFLIDLLIVFLLYALSQKSVIKNIEPTIHALDNLAQGTPTTVHFKGILGPIGRRINKTSELLIQKETARKSWVAGVSHDVRTPLSVIMGYAERLERTEELPCDVRKSAQIITRQGIRIRDLIEDLNIATQLEYDMQPLRTDHIIVPRLLREMISDYLNQSNDERFVITLIGTDHASLASLQGDERLIKRALRNAIDNAMKHNPAGCHIEITLEDHAGHSTITIADNGRGMSTDHLLALTTMLQNEYLGKDSLIAYSETYAVFGAAHTAFPKQNSAPGSPLPPPEAMTGINTYGDDVVTPEISSWRTRKKTPQSPHTIPHQPESPYNKTQQSSTAMPSSPTKGIIQHGLGIPLIARIVITHGGEFTLASEEGKGFCIIMRF